MAKKQKRVVGQTSSKKTVKVAKAATKATPRVTSQPKEELLFGKRNYIFMGGGLLLIIVGLVLMSGGGMEDPNVWDEGRIYSFRRITLAPFVILAGLILNYMALFQKKD